MLYDRPAGRIDKRTRGARPAGRIDKGKYAARPAGRIDSDGAIGYTTGHGDI